MQRPETVVDYAAWNKGYTPPSEHILIDQLAYRGARVVMSMDWADSGAVWVVIRGDKILKRELRKQMQELISLALESADEGLPTAEDVKGILKSAEES